MRIPSETRFGPILSVAIGTIGVAACSGFPLSGHGNSALPAQRSGTLALRPADGGGSPIRRVIIVIQENRSFDNFFATFPGADGATSGLAAVTPSPGGSATPGPTPTPKVVPLAKRDLVTHGYFANVHGAWLKDYDGGAMDGFDEEEYFPRSGPTKAAGTRPYYYVDPARIKPYWTMAKRYALADHMFQTQTSASFTAHQYLIAGSTKIDATQSVVDLPTSSVWGCNAPPGTVTSLLDSDGTYVQRGGPFPCFTYKTIRDFSTRRASRGDTTPLRSTPATGPAANGMPSRRSRRSIKARSGRTATSPHRKPISSATSRTAHYRPCRGSYRTGSTPTIRVRRRTAGRRGLLQSSTQSVRAVIGRPLRSSSCGTIGAVFTTTSVHRSSATTVWGFECR